ncbi:MAG: SycD/LcrH family type III secretion system chaperone [Janthinobacterium lividum]
MNAATLPENDSRVATLTRELPDFLAGGGTVGALLGYPPEQLEAAYGYARALYEEARYEDALSLFAFLSFNDHLAPRYHWGLGACAQMLGRHEEAMQAYGMLVAMDMSDPAPIYRIAECLLALGRRDEARETLDVVVALADEDTAEHRALRRRAQAMLTLLKGDCAP